MLATGSGRHPLGGEPSIDRDHGNHRLAVHVGDQSLEDTTPGHPDGFGHRFPVPLAHLLGNLVALRLYATPARSRAWVALVARPANGSPPLDQMFPTGRRLVRLRPEVGHRGDETVGEREEHHGVSGLGPLDLPDEPGDAVFLFGDGDPDLRCQAPGYA